jgi:hypothetical protein
MVFTSCRNRVHNRRTIARFPDEVLGQLYVIVSIHASLTLSEAVVTNRIIKAMSILM